MLLPWSATAGENRRHELAYDRPGWIPGSHVRLDVVRCFCSSLKESPRSEEARTTGGAFEKDFFPARRRAHAAIEFSSREPEANMLRISGIRGENFSLIPSSGIARRRELRGAPLCRAPYGRSSERQSAPCIGAPANLRRVRRTARLASPALPAGSDLVWPRQQARGALREPMRRARRTRFRHRRPPPDAAGRPSASRACGRVSPS